MSTVGDEKRETVTLGHVADAGDGKRLEASEYTCEATWVGSGGNTTAPNADRKYRDEVPRTGADENLSPPPQTPTT